MDCSNLRQGDVVGLRRLPVPGTGDASEIMATPDGIAILSQTCDVVQPSKVRCLVAPVMVDATDGALSSARKGQKPLHLYLESTIAEPARCLADMERAVSIPKAALVGLPITARYVEQQSGRAARALAWRVGRAFSRFPFPDEVYPAFSKLRRQAQDKAGSTQSNFGRVLDYVEDLRVAADQWPKAARNLTLYIVVPEELLIVPDDVDPGWLWSPERVVGLRTNEQEIELSIDRVSELILANLEADKSSLAHLWRLFGEIVQAKLLSPMLDHEVATFEVVVLSDAEMTFRQYQQTESLDLEVLSDSTDTEA
ncbi:MAG: hypothetical protein GX454_12405 [Brooklawnia sp.]|nr:hypothetical protein [Brooklawnia sp.]